MQQTFIGIRTQFENACPLKTFGKTLFYLFIFLCNIGLINHSIKLDTKIIWALEIDLVKLFESSVKTANVAAPDVKIIRHDT